MRDELITTLEDGTDLMAVNPMVQVGRLLQLAQLDHDRRSDQRRPDTDRAVHQAQPPGGGPGRDPEDESVVVWFAHRKLLHLAEARLERAGIDFVPFHGQMADHDRALAEQSFQAGNVRIMLLTIGAGKEGITLTKAATQIYVQRTWSLIDDLQSQDRLHRPGQTADKVTIIDLIAEDTVEERLHEVLDGKAEGLEAVVQDREALLRVLR
jgi:SNF2 family DNA or RNA helicase